MLHLFSLGPMPEQSPRKANRQVSARLSTPLPNSLFPPTSSLLPSFSDAQQNKANCEITGQNQDRHLCYHHCPTNKLQSHMFSSLNVLATACVLPSQKCCTASWECGFSILAHPPRKLGLASTGYAYCNLVTSPPPHLPPPHPETV